MPFTVSLDDARVAFEMSVGAFSAAVGSLNEWDLLASSRCHGWTRPAASDGGVHPPVRVGRADGRYRRGRAQLKQTIRSG